jgi:GNAT superfamily N-acetyltransferase
MSTTIEVERVDDLGRVRAFLTLDPFSTAYMLGDLDPTYSGYCTWFMAREGARDCAVVQLYTGLSAPVLITHGSSAGLSAILSAFVGELPSRAHIHLMPEHLAVLDRHFALDRLRPMVRMALASAGFERLAITAASPPYRAVERMGHRDTGEIMELFAHYPDSFFEPHQLSTGHYYGIRLEPRPDGAPGTLVAVAGIHVVSRNEGIAVLGNIVTHPDHRGRGLSTRVTSHLCGALIDDGVELLALNVERKNDAALRVYEKLGFHEHCTYLEGFATRTLGRVLSDAVVGTAGPAGS